MGLLDRFKKNGQQSVLPQEVKEYYQSEKRQKRGVAIALALVALIVTVAIASGLFFGGRYVYNKIKGNDSSQQAGKTNDEKDWSKEGAENKDQTPRPLSGTNSTTPTGPTPTPPAPSPAPSSPAPQPQPAPATPPLGDETMPRTGDEGM